jgi:hypothetical protein
MILDDKGLEAFKTNLSDCYQKNRFSQTDRVHKHLFFNTQMEGLQLWFSINEVGSFLSLLQEAALSYAELNYQTS